MSLRKENWNQIRFDEVADCLERHSKNPIIDGFDRYVGLEDINGETLRIESSGEIAKGTTFTKIFNNGDILFGKRRPYLRKIAVADFNGICSGDILVFRNKKSILPELLPIYVSSQSFINYAIKTSAGSLSPRTKWKDLAKFDILLPPIEEQRQIATLFQSIEAAINKIEIQKKNIKSLWLKLIDEFVSERPSFGNLLENRNLQTVTYAEVTEKLMRRIDPISYGIERIVAGENLESEDFRVRTWQIVGKGYLGPAFHVLFKPGDILYGSRRTYLKKVASAHFEGVCANTTYVIRAKEKLLLQDLLKHIMLSDRFTKYSIGVSKGSTNPYINWKDLDNFTFQIPDNETQKKISEVLDDVVNLIENLKTQQALLKSLKQKILNEIFS